MLSKNNSNERKRKSELQNKQEHFSLRKLTIGTTSVLLGFSFIQANNQVVKADAIKGPDEENEENVTANKAGKAAAKQKEAVPVKSKQANLATYAGLTSFLRGELEVPQESQGSTSSAAASSTSTAESSAAAGSSTGSAASSAASTPVSASSTGMGSVAAASAASVGSTPDSTGAEKLPEPEPVTVGPQGDTNSHHAEGLDGNCKWTYDSRSKTITFTAMADNSHDNSLAAGMLGTTSVLTNSRSGLDHDKSDMTYFPSGIPVNAIKVIKLDNSQGQIKLNQNSRFKFANLTDLKEIEGLDGVDTSSVWYMDNMFENDIRLLHLNLNNWDMSNVISMDNMFRDNDSLKSLTMAHGINHTGSGNTASGSPQRINLNYNDDDYYSMFYGDGALTEIVLPKIRVSKLNYSDFGVLRYTLKKLDVSQLITDGITSLGCDGSNSGGVFSGFRSLTDLTGLEKLNVSQVDNMAGLFSGDSSLTKLDLSTWDTSGIAQEDRDNFPPNSENRVENAYLHYSMSNMFSGDSALTTLILGPGWDTSKVYSMHNMFSDDTNLKTISGSAHWDMGHVAHAEGMFMDTYHLTNTSLTNIGVSDWNTSNFKNMDAMFFGLSSSLSTAPEAHDDPVTTLDLSNWDTSQVTDMASMFYSAKNLATINLSTWNTSQVTNMSQMFSYASGLTSLDLSKWDTSKVTNMFNMFLYTSHLQTLNLGKNQTTNSQTFVTTRVADMHYMFKGTGSANDYANTLHLELGNFKITVDAWSGFNPLGFDLEIVKLVKIDGHYQYVSDGAISFGDLENRYNAEPPIASPDHIYTLLLHNHGNKRYSFDGTVPVIYAHKGMLKAQVANDLENLNSVTLKDKDDSNNYYPIKTLKSKEDYFKTKGDYTIKSITWEDGKNRDDPLDTSKPDPKVMKNNGSLDSGGAIDFAGNITSDAANKTADQKGNAVVRVTFGDGTFIDVPVNVWLPTVEEGTGQYTQKNMVPSETKAKAALKIGGDFSSSSTTPSAPVSPAPGKWGNNNWTLSYSWMIKDSHTHDWRELKSDDLPNPGQYDVGVKISYTTPTGEDDGSQIEPVKLEVQNYDSAYKIAFKNTGLLHEHQLTVPSSDNSDPVEFNDPGKWKDFLDVRPVTDQTLGTTGPAITEGLSEIIQKVEWVAKPTLNLGTNIANQQIKITYQDGATALVGNPSTNPVYVDLSGGQASSAEHSVSINHSNELNATTAKEAIDITKIATGTYNNLTYSWSVHGDASSTPNVTHTGTQNIYVLIDYHDGTKQAVPVTLKVTSLSQTCTPTLTGNHIIIHATSSGTGESVDSDHHSLVPIITNSDKINDLLTLTDSGTPVTYPSDKISKIVWHQGDEPHSDGSASQTHKIDIVYTDGSVTSLNGAQFDVEGAAIDTANHANIEHSGSDYSVAYVQGTVPTAESLVVKPNAAHFVPTYKWVRNDPTHDELSLSDLNDGTIHGTINAAIEVTYSDNTHQYLPITLTINTRAGVSRCTGHDQTVPVGKKLTLDKHLVSVIDTATNTDVNKSEYSLSWVDGAPDLTAANLGNANEKQISKTIKVTFNRGDSTQLVNVTITLVGAKLKTSASPKRVYLGSSGADIDQNQVNTIASYYLDTSKISSLPPESKPAYALTQTGDTVTLTVTYGGDSNAQQVFTNIPLKLVRGQISNNVLAADQNSVLGSNYIRQVLLNYDDVASTGAYISDAITGINLTQLGEQYGNFVISFSSSGFPTINETIPVTVMVSHTDVSKAIHSADSKIVKLLSGSVIVPQHTDLAAHNEYAKGAVTSVNAMPNGCEYVWDKDHIPATDKEGTYSSFVNVCYPNGTFVSVPVKVTVVGPTLNEAILMHNSYIYNQDANRVTNRVLQQGLKVKTYGTALLEGKLYYHLEGNQYVKAGNIDGQKRRLIKTSYVYDKSGQRIADKTIYEGTEITTYGAHVKIKHGKYYAIGINEFIKADAIN
ncbi:BspA family leucine-rich repeat surface protein [Lactobacillus sp. ESL0791]|uniref:BspA family leucine-rich repeat surface protein n=1 Tax=Lactobacillus sp. ESL0791 TaxID=2983234 RepID=UPI0023F7AF02|nr:BspA family leucine-rich repeat surface protein [Lactobacillus sp. ESL0791]MDF7639791.1 BspA family leucine-rich repeat surface protein [Lactobacillus sp. ESL0791]